MRYRYQIRNVTGETISCHTSYIGAFDSLGHVRAQLERFGTECTAFVWDTLMSRRAESTIDALVESVGLHVRLTPEENASLRQIAAELGVLTERGGRKGESGHQPSRAGLVKGIARREFVVTKRHENA